MTYAEYAELDHPVPYVVQIERDEGALLYFGSRHVFDPAHAQIDEIELAWREFGPTIAYNEGGNPSPRDTREASVREAGEAGWVRFLAQRDCVVAASLEPERADEVATLIARGYSSEQVKVFYALRQVAHHRTSAQEEPLEAYLRRVLDDLSRTPGLEGTPRSLIELKECGDLVLPRMVDCMEVTDEWFDPIGRTQHAYTNEMSAVLSVLRDEHMVRLLCAAVRRGERVFAVVGASHVVMQEPRLRALIGPR